MDTDLVVRAQHGDEEAFASLAVAAGDRLHAVAHRILRDIDLAEDAIHASGAAARVRRLSLNHPAANPANTAIAHVQAVENGTRDR